MFETNIKYLALSLRDMKELNRYESFRRGKPKSLDIGKRALLLNIKELRKEMLFIKLLRVKGLERFLVNWVGRGINGE